MNFESLNILRTPSYVTSASPYIGEITILTESAKTTLVLNERQIQKILEISASALVDSATAIASNLTATIITQKDIPNELSRP